MSLDMLVKELEMLSVDDLCTLQEQIISQLRAKVRVDSDEDDDSWFTTYTDEENKREIAEIFTPEELEAARKVDLNNLRPLPKPLSHYIMEERGGHVEQCDICSLTPMPLQSFIVLKKVQLG